MSMSIRRTRHRGPASTGRNRVYRSPNGLIPEFLWSKHRLNKIKRVQTNIARSNQEVGDLIIVAPEPDPLTVVGSLSLAEPSGFDCRYLSIDVGRDLLLATAGDYLKVVDISDPTNPTLLSTVSGFQSLTNQNAIDTDNAGTWCAIRNSSTNGTAEVWRSTDDGQTWTKVADLSDANGTTEANSVAHDRNGMWWAHEAGTIGKDSVHYSTDGGATWTSWDISGVVAANRTGVGVMNGEMVVGQGPFASNSVYEIRAADLGTTYTNLYSAGTIYGIYLVARTPAGKWFVAAQTSVPSSGGNFPPGGPMNAFALPAGIEWGRNSADDWTHHYGRLVVCNGSSGLVLSSDDGATWSAIPGPGNANVTCTFAHHAT